MKQRKCFVFAAVVAAMLFAFLCPAQAMGFVAEQTYESVFIVCSGSALGSGFAVGENCVVTNAHVIHDPGQVSLWTYGGETHEARVLGMDEDRDIAVLAVADVCFPVLTAADPAGMNTGDDVYAIGAPQSMAYTLTKGVISAKERSFGRYSYIQIDAPINEGNSGGPLLNEQGQVLGMTTMKMNDSEGLGLAIPMSSISEYLGALSLELDEAGNVVGEVAVPAASASGETQPLRPNREDREEAEEEPLPARTPLPAAAVAAYMVAGVSLALNVILAVLLVGRKRKEEAPAGDPRERTDFDIDILE